MKWCINVFLKYLTPSVAHRDSRLNSPLYISASPTSRFFIAGPRFVSSSTQRYNQSSTISSYLNQDVDPSKVVEFLIVIPLPAEKSDVDFAQHAPTNDSFDSFFKILIGNHQNHPHSHSALGLSKSSQNTHSRVTLFATKSYTFTTQQPRSATTLWLLICSFCLSLWRLYKIILLVQVVVQKRFP